MSRLRERLKARLKRNKRPLWPEPIPKRPMGHSPHVVFLILFFAALFLYVIEGGLIFSGLFYAAVLIPLVALPYCLVVRWQMHLSHQLSAPMIERGRTVLYTYALQNWGPFPTPVVYLCVQGDRRLFFRPICRMQSCGPFARSTGQALIAPNHRGPYTLAMTDAACSDLFGIFHLRPKRPPHLSLLVLPRLLPPPGEWVERMGPILTEGERIIAADQPAVDARNYRYGDSIRRIHWNLTARSREIMVREYESQTEFGLLCVLDTAAFQAERPLDCEDVIVETCLSVLHYALRRQMKTTFVYHAGSELCRLQGTDERLIDQMQVALAAVTFAGQPSLTEMLTTGDTVHCIALFTPRPPAAHLLSQLPKDCPAEVFAVQTYRGMTPPETIPYDNIHVTLLQV